MESPDERVSPVPGTIFAVRYDPEDHARMAIDADQVAEDLWNQLTAIKAAADAQKARADATQAL